MKICITSTGIKPSSPVDFRFGRCQYLAISDDSKEIDCVENNGFNTNHGAGIATAQKVIDLGADVVLTGNIGPNAMNLLKASGIKIFQVKGDTVEEALKLYKKKDLIEIDRPVPSHYGMRHRAGRGRG